MVFKCNLWVADLLSLSSCSAVSTWMVTQAVPRGYQQHTQVMSHQSLPQMEPQPSLTASENFFYRPTEYLCVCRCPFWRHLGRTHPWNIFKYLATNNPFTIWVSMQACIAIIPYLHKGSSLCCWLRYTQVCI